MDESSYGPVSFTLAWFVNMLTRLMPDATKLTLEATAGDNNIRAQTGKIHLRIKEGAVFLKKMVQLGITLTTFLNGNIIFVSFSQFRLVTIRSATSVNITLLVIQDTVPEITSECIATAC